MKTVVRNAGLLARLGLTATALLLSQQVLAVGTDAGVTVSNQATVAYDVGTVGQLPIPSDPLGNSDPAAGNTTDFLVDRRVDFTLTADGVTATVTPGDSGLTFDFTLTNTSNGPLDFQISLAQLTSGDPAVNTLLDTDADVANTTFAAYVDNLAEDGNTTVTITGDAALSLINGDVANIQITATAFDPAGDAGTPVALVDGAGQPDDPAVVDNVFADAGNDGAESAEDGIQVVSAALAITKTLDVLSDPFGGVTPNAKAVPGALIEYTVVVDNSGGASDALNVVVTDNIQIPDVLFEADAYNPGEDVIVGGTPCNASDNDLTDGCAYNAGTGLLTLNVGTVAATGTTTITYQVRVNVL